MQSVNQPDIPHEILSSGVDWITATAQKGSTRWDMQEYADNQRRRLMDSGETIKQGYRLGYYGWQCEGFFHGNREGGSIVVASGAVAHNVFRAVVNVSDHISRLDVQTTVAFPHDRPHLGVQAYTALKSGLPSKVKVKNVTLITSQPEGETVNIGKRSSDLYARLYDKATEAGLGEARSVWRYEVELKRRPAGLAAAHLRGDPTAEAVALSIVHDHFSARGVAPVFPRSLTFCPQKPTLTGVNRNILTWFEESLSITVARAVERHGLARVLEALGLASQVDIKRK
jgi:hypothetical protein